VSLRLAVARLALLVTVSALTMGPPKPSGAQTFTAMGVGNQSCGTWTAERRIGTAGLLEEWVLGFLSGIGYVGDHDNPLAGTDADGVFAWIDNYCFANPINDTSQGAKAFDTFHPNRTTP
jgi:hypothetical protein